MSSGSNKKAQCHPPIQGGKVLFLLDPPQREFTSSRHLCLLVHEGKLKHSNEEITTFFWEQEFLRGFCKQEHIGFFSPSSQKDMLHCKRRLVECAYIRLSWKHYFGTEQTQTRNTSESSFRDIRFQTVFISMVYFSESVGFPTKWFLVELMLIVLTKTKKRYFRHAAKYCEQV